MDTRLKIQVRHEEGVSIATIAGKLTRKVRESSTSAFGWASSSSVLGWSRRTFWSSLVAVPVSTRSVPAGTSTREVSPPWTEI